MDPHVIRAELKDAVAAKYLTAAGLVVLIYDHFLTFSDELELYWQSKDSFSKYGFLTNRYVVPAMLIAISVESSDLWDATFSDASCRRLLATSSSIGVVSISLANILVLIGVVRLWDKNRTVMWLLGGAFVVTTGATAIGMVLTIAQLYDGIQYSPIAKMCIFTSTTSALLAVWAPPMIFELLMLIITFWNTADRPRDGRMTFIYGLQIDGVPFFVILFLLRLMNLVFAASGGASRSLIGVFFVWGLVTVVLSRSLFYSRLVDPQRRFTDSVAWSTDGSRCRMPADRICDLGNHKAGRSAELVYDDLNMRWATFTGKSDRSDSTYG